MGLPRARANLSFLERLKSLAKAYGRFNKKEGSAKIFSEDTLQRLYMELNEYVRLLTTRVRQHFLGLIDETLDTADTRGHIRVAGDFGGYTMILEKAENDQGV